ncbi:MAG: NAD(P)H-dependent glycerol-3-phosphate dehydrogenase [Bacteroidales bacterium]|nr:NAD(P)H-dependent glycerol-3-phosphate dehydrogenase [Bacteroidales bacterium]HNT41455.1 NAD(P)H-dependent glycerol-3-phosphate dehydrogenase [Tenuifilaceae bacterium]MBP8643614.1 NAD(P)H-dependent glycerol-3-phosphate dehydrogenase [Bacteroidales bacterium]HOA09407.1 NAD(P)H-dependent glycerol-3-phosphate dehydrogenase [Tenuifilaceae bacterium]HOG72030.1 NAD(P)H-dependent glycerol-3-phosphate dehydrogenase [Tenuifilaceae bacterium]
MSTNAEIEKKPSIAVVGSGSWATALAKVLHETQDSIGWCLRDPELIGYIKKYRHNPNYLSAVEFDVKKLYLSVDINEVAKLYDILLFVIPSTYFQAWLEPLSVSLEGKFIISAIKGIVPGMDCTIAEFFNQQYGVPFDRIGIVSGPTHAEEVALERLSYLTISCKDKLQAKHVASYFETHYIKTNIGTDIYGTEYSAVLKNIYAVASGIAHGLNYGDNFLAVLISNAQREIERFLKKTYPSKRRLSTSVYLGDLLVTCYSQFSRNRTFGTMIGKGYSVKSAMLEMSMVAEGYNAAKCIWEINKKYNVKMPIANAVYNILYENISPAIEMKLLTAKLR